MINQIDKQFMPKFLGIGSAFNTKLGNTSCFFIKEGIIDPDDDEQHSKIDLIDCGWDVYKKLVDKGYLKDQPYINIYVSHRHGDHIGSLSTLLEHSYYINGKSCNIITSETIKLEETLKLLLVDKELYQIYSRAGVGDNSFMLPHIIRSYNVNSSCAHKIEKDGYIYYFAWDSAGISPDIWNDFIKEYEKSKMQNRKSKVYLFHDCCLGNFPGNPHTYYKLLLDLVPEELRPNVFPVHIDDEKVLDIMVEAGFGDVRELLV